MITARYFKGVQPSGYSFRGHRLVSGTLLKGVISKALELPMAGSKTSVGATTSPQHHW
jgi:hypothetical protein